MAKRGNHEGTINQLPSGSWRAQIYIKGQRIGRSFKKKSQAQDWLRDKSYEVGNGLRIKDSQMLLKDYFQNWLMYKKNSVKDGIWSQYESVIRLYISPTIGKIKLADLSQNYIQSVYQNLRLDYVGERTIRLIHSTLHCSLGDAVKRKIIQSNPTDLICAPKYEPPEMKILTEDEINTFLITIQGHPIEALYFMAITTGLRQSELLGLKWSDLDWNNCSMKVLRQLKRGPKRNGYFGSLKTKHSKRTIKLGQETMRKLHGRLIKQQTYQGNSSWEENDLIFSTKYGTPIRQANLYNQFKSLLQEAGLPDIRFHDLRHTAATIMLNNGISILTVSRRLGHSKPSITLDVYGHIMPSMQASIADQIDELISPGTIEIAHELHLRKRLSSIFI